MTANPYRNASIAGFPGYFVSARGEVFSRVRGPVNRGGWIIDIPHRLSATLAGREYRKVTLCRVAEHITRYVHDLVAEAFVPGKAAGLQVRHIDGDKEHNFDTNLLWGTAKENGADSVRQGKTTKGERNAMAKLTEFQIGEIRRLLFAGTLSQKRIAEQFGVAQSLVSLINTGKIWGHVPQEGIDHA